MSTRTYLSICVYLRKCLRCIHFREYVVLVSVISHGQEYRPYGALCRIGRLRCCVVVLCSLNVFGCVNGLLRSFVYLFDCDCIVCGIDCCGRAMSPNGAILLHSPGRKPWVNYWNTSIEPRWGAALQCEYWVVVEVLLKTSGLCHILWHNPLVGCE